MLELAPFVLAHEKALKERLSAGSSKGASGCINWGRRKNKDGYGEIFVKGYGKARTHRVAFLLNGGVLPRNGCVLHKCDNPACVNPEHLYAGDQRQNVYDCISRGRRLSKLNEERVRLLRFMRSMGASYYALGRIFDVTPTVARRIAVKQYWSRVQ